MEINHNYINTFMRLCNILIERHPKFIKPAINVVKKAVSVVVKVLQTAVSVVIKILLRAVKGELLQIWKKHKGVLANLSQLSANATIRQFFVFLLGPHYGIEGM